MHPESSCVVASEVSERERERARQPRVRMSLSNEEIEACREAFARFDKDNSGAIDAWELRATLQCVPPHAPS